MSAACPWKRNPATAQAIAGVELIRMDICDEASIRQSVEHVIAEAGRIDVLVNSAGMTLLGATEETSITDGSGAVRHHLHKETAPVHYVENSLLCSLFGLLCWDAIFAPLPGAFFHPFHSGPVDLYSADFHTRRQELFDHCLDHLDRDDYRDLIRQRYQEKFGTQSPFVFWHILDERLLEQALHCIPARHLHACFERMLRDLKANRAGMPDLIQFYPAEQRYRMIEVKGPGDRLQDNQKRWLAFAAEHGIPVEVCYVSRDAS